MYTSGAKAEFGDEFVPVIDSKNCCIIGSYKFSSYDTFGPFKLVGGLNKHHPDDKDILSAVNSLKTSISDKLFYVFHKVRQPHCYIRVVNKKHGGFKL